MIFELLVWADGTSRLYSEDSLHGEDIVVALEADGKAYHCYYDEDGDTVREEVDLVEFLRSLAGKENDETSMRL